LHSNLAAHALHLSPLLLALTDCSFPIVSQKRFELLHHISRWADGTKLFWETIATISPSQKGESTMRYIYCLLAITLLAFMGVAAKAEADSWAETPIEFTMVSGPTDGLVSPEEHLIHFSAPGSYLLQLTPLDADAVQSSDSQIAVDVKAAGALAFIVTAIEAPEGGQAELTQGLLRFSTPGHYRLRVAATEPNLLQFTDDQIAVTVKSVEEIAAEEAAITGQTPFIETAEQKTDAAFRAFLPLVSSSGGATATTTTTMTETHDHAASTPVAIAAASVNDFGAFDKNRLPVEMQAWWTPAFGHIHLAALVPFGQPVRGIIEIPIRIVFHDNPSVLQYLSVHTDEKPQLRIPMGDLRCTQEVCAWAFTIRLDTTKMSSGWRELRLRTDAETPDGNRFLSSSGIPILVQNGGKVKHYERYCNNTGLMGRGWYDGFGYTVGIIECVPTAPVKGVVTFRARAHHASKHLRIDLDKSHFIPAVGLWPQQNDTAGVTLFDKTGNFSSSKNWISVTIDTRSLSNGWHTLAVQSTGPKGDVSRCPGCPNVLSFPAGVAKMWFYVQN